MLTGLYLRLNLSKRWKESLCAYDDVHAKCEDTDDLLQIDPFKLTCMSKVSILKSYAVNPKLSNTPDKVSSLSSL